MGQLKESEETALKKVPLNRSCDLSVNEGRQPIVTRQEKARGINTATSFLSHFGTLPIDQTHLGGRRPRYVLILSLLVNLPDTGARLGRGVDKPKLSYTGSPEPKTLYQSDIFLYFIFLYFQALGSRISLRATS